MNGIFADVWLLFMVNVGYYTSPMDPKGACFDIISLAKLKRRHRTSLQKR